MWLFWLCCRRRKITQRGKPVNHHSRRKGQSSHICARNPIFVFTLSFLVLASLRFRVRTKKTAQNWINRGRQRISSSSSIDGGRSSGGAVQSRIKQPYHVEKNPVDNDGAEYTATIILSPQLSNSKTPGNEAIVQKYLQQQQQREPYNKNKIQIQFISAKGEIVTKLASDTEITTTSTAEHKYPLTTMASKNRPLSTTRNHQHRTIAYELTVENDSSSSTATGRQIQPTEDPSVLRFRAVWVPDPGNLFESHGVKTSHGLRSHGAQVEDSTKFNAQGKDNHHEENHLLNHSLPSVTVAEWVQYLLHDDRKNNGLLLLDQFIQILQHGNSFQGYFWETLGVTPQTASSTAFEFVLVDAPELTTFVAQQQQEQKQQLIDNKIPGPIEPPNTFREPFRKCMAEQTKNNHHDRQGSTTASSICVFTNFGGDATLISPLPLSFLDTPTFQRQEQRQSMMNSQQHDFSYGHLAAFVRHAPYSQVRELWIRVLELYAEKLDLPPLVPTDSDQNKHSNSSWYDWFRQKFTGERPQQPSDPQRSSKFASSPSTSATSSTTPRLAGAGATVGSKEALPQQQRQKLWLSTSGMGVPWVHIRFDQIPKYYTYKPFAT